MQKSSGMLFIAMCQMVALGAMPEKTTFTLKCPAFVEGNPIPVVYTAAPGGKDISPPLGWLGAPENTESFALICEDVNIPLIGAITHWIIYNIPSDACELKEAIPVIRKLDDGSEQGKNFYRKPGYMGPNPPMGTHRYVFKLFALDRMLQFNNTPGKQDLLKAMNGHILGKAEMTGTFSR